MIYFVSFREDLAQNNSQVAMLYEWLVTCIVTSIGGHFVFALLINVRVRTDELKAGHTILNKKKLFLRSFKSI